MENERCFNQLSRYALHLVDTDERKTRRIETRSGRHSIGIEVANVQESYGNGTNHFNHF